MADGQVSQGLVLALERSAPAAQVTQAFLLALAPSPAHAAEATQAAVLALTQETLQALVGQVAVLALVSGVPCLTHWAQCWRIVRADGAVFTFTAHDRDIEFRGELYRTCASLSASALETGAFAGAAGSVTLSGIISDDAITEADLMGGLFDGAFVEVWMVPWEDDGTVPWRMVAGRAGAVSVSGEGDPA